MKDFTPLDDEALMLAYQAGDATAFEALYPRCAGRVYGYLKARLKRPEERDEVFQQVFLKFHRARQQYSAEYTLTQWLYVITKSVLLDFLRKKRRNPSDLASEGTEFLEQVPSPLSQMGQAPTYEGVEPSEALQSLSFEQQQVVSWRVLDDLTYQEIASKLNRSESSVRQILSRALRKLRESAHLKESKG